MPSADGASAADEHRSPVGHALWGGEESRLRATWRVLLAWPVLWVLTGAVLAGNVQGALPWIPARGPVAGLAQSLLHAGFFLAILVGWARYVDHEALADYGVAASGRWAWDLIVGFVAVVAGFGVWVAAGTVLGDTAVDVSTTTSGGSFLAGLGVLAVALLLHAVLQQVVFFRVVLVNAAEGLRSRDVEPSWCLAGSVVVSVLCFVAMHGAPGGLRVVDLAIVGSIFGLVFIQTGSLGVGTGMQFGALYAGNVLFTAAGTGGSGPAIFQLSGSMPGFLGTLGGYGFPKLVLAYLFVLALLRWRRGALTVHPEIARRVA